MVNVYVRTYLIDKPDRSVYYFIDVYLKSTGMYKTFNIIIENGRRMPIPLSTYDLIFPAMTSYFRT